MRMRVAALLVLLSLTSCDDDAGDPRREWLECIDEAVSIAWDPEDADREWTAGTAWNRCTHILVEQDLRPCESMCWALKQLDRSPDTLSVYLRARVECLADDDWYLRACF